MAASVPKCRSNKGSSLTTCIVRRCWQDDQSRAAPCKDHANSDPTVMYHCSRLLLSTHSSSWLISSLAQCKARPLRPFQTYHPTYCCVSSNCCWITRKSTWRQPPFSTSITTSDVLSMLFTGSHLYLQFPSSSVLGSRPLKGHYTGMLSYQPRKLSTHS